MIQETIEQSNVAIMETILFTKITASTINKSKVGHLLPVIKFVASDWGLDIKRGANLNTVKRIIIHYAKLN